MHFLLSIILFVFCAPNLFCQEFFVGLGFEINQTRFRQEAPTVQTKFSNPHKAGIGMSANTSFALKLKGKYMIRLKQGLAISRTKSEVTSSKMASYANLSLDFGHYFNDKISVNVGAEYSHLIELISTFNGQSSDFTFFANHINFINPTIGIAYELDKNWSTHLRFVYFSKDLFNSGALDIDGNIVGPIMVSTYIIGLGFNFNFKLN